MTRIQRIAACFLSGWISLAGWGMAAAPETGEPSYLHVRQKAEGFRRAGDFQRAIRSYEEALSLTGQPGADRRRLDCLFSLGLLKWNVGHMDESAADFARALALSRKLKDDSRTSACLKILAIHDRYLQGKTAATGRQYRQSIRHFESAVALSRELALPELEIKCLRQLSLNHFELEMMEDFLELNQKALGIARSLNHRTEEARCLNNIGLYFFKANRYSKALAHYENALLILSRADNNEEDKADCLNNIALVYLNLGSYDKALRYLRDAMKIDLLLNSAASVLLDLKNIGMVLRNKGEVNNNIAEVEESLVTYLRCLALLEQGGARDLQADLMNNIGLAHYSLANYRTALHYFRSALNQATLSRRQGDIGAIACNLGQAFLQIDEVARAKAQFIDSIDLAVRVNREEILWEAYFGLAQCFEKENQADTALMCYENAAGVIDTIRQQLSWDEQKTGFARDKWKVYDAWIRLLSQKSLMAPSEGMELMIWRTVQRAKARSLCEGLAQAGHLRQRSFSPEQTKDRKRLTRSISVFLSRLAQPGLSSEEKKSLLEAMERAEDEYNYSLNPNGIDNYDHSDLASGVASIEEVQRILLDTESVMVEYFLGETQSLAIFITPNQIKIKHLPSRLSIEKSLRAYLKLLSTPPNDKFLGHKAGQRIYKELFPDIDGWLGRPKSLIIIPDGILGYLPFEALIQGHEANGANRFLVEDYQISYAPSASALTLLIRRKPATQRPMKILAFGNAKYAHNLTQWKEDKTQGEVMREIYQDNGFEFSPLPYSKREIRQIASFFPGKIVDRYEGAEATEETIKKNSLLSYRVIHFACHGFLDEEAPQRSALVLSLDNDLDEDGFLQAREICGLQLDADLVVLSACQTGRGKIENGEGILGLPRMFFYAGARSAISSLWRITDRSTTILMREFYRWLSAGSGRAWSLREAKLRMLRSKYSHPFYWAGFILNGDFCRL